MNLGAERAKVRLAPSTAIPRYSYFLAGRFRLNAPHKLASTHRMLRLSRCSCSAARRLPAGNTAHEPQKTKIRQWARVRDYRRCQPTIWHIRAALEEGERNTLFQIEVLRVRPTF